MLEDYRKQQHAFKKKKKSAWTELMTFTEIQHQFNMQDHERNKYYIIFEPEHKT